MMDGWKRRMGRGGTCARESKEVSNVHDYPIGYTYIERVRKRVLGCPVLERECPVLERVCALF